MKQLKIIVLLASVALMMNASFAGATRVSSLSGWLIWGPTDGEKYEIIDRYRIALGSTYIIVVTKDDMPHILPLLTMTGVSYLKSK